MSTPHLVQPSAIQEELSKIWDSLEGANKMRASLFNLIFFTTKSPREGYLHTIAQKVIEKFPSRVIFVSSDNDPSQNYLKTSVSVMPAQKGEYDVACDYIQIEVAGPQKAQIPFLLLPHILADLPIYVLWAEDPSVENPLIHQIETFASRLIYDSECTDNLPNFAKTLLKHYEDSGLEVADLNWGRLEGWRDLLASTFYSDEKLKSLENVVEISINYNSHKTTYFTHSKIQSVYLQCWIASQLNWKLKETRKDNGNLLFIYQKEKGEVKVTLTPQEQSNLPTGLILRVELKTTSDEHFLFQRNMDYSFQISLVFSTADRCEIPSNYFFQKAESGHSLVKEITRKGTSSHFLKVLHNIANMGNASLC
jgi:glucose-6-phosphate dehydrogenase assembly protein OpcA